MDTDSTSILEIINRTGLTIRSGASNPIENKGATAITKATVLALLEACREKYEKTADSLALLSAYSIARRYRLPLPEWVLLRFDVVFSEYVTKKGAVSLEHTFGFKKKGQGKRITAFDKRELEQRDMFCMCMLDSVRRQYEGMSIEDAALVAYNAVITHTAGKSVWVIPNPAKLAWKYKTEGWKKWCSDSNPFLSCDFLQYIPKELQDKHHINPNITEPHSVRRGKHKPVKDEEAVHREAKRREKEGFLRQMERFEEDWRDLQEARKNKFTIQMIETRDPDLGKGLRSILKTFPDCTEEELVDLYLEIIGNRFP